MQMNKPLSDILLVSDMDGTLVTPRFGVPRRNVLAVERFIEKGGKFAFATGRSEHSAVRYVGQVAINAPSIVFNGAVIYDFTGKVRKWQAFLPGDAGEELKRVIALFPDIGVEIFAGGRLYLVNRNSWTLEHVKNENIEYCECGVDEVPPGWNKALFSTDHERLRELQADMENRSHPGWDLLFSSTMYYEMLPSGVNKGSTLGILAELLGIPRGNTFAIGDYYNDLELVRSAQFSAVPAQAPEELKQAANLVVGPCEDGAVADFIEYIEKTYGERVPAADLIEI